MAPKEKPPIKKFKAVGQVEIIQMNNNQGDFTEFERVFLFMGEAAADCKYYNKVLAVSSGSDLDDLLGASESILKTLVEAAILNAESANWAAYVMPVKAEDDWEAPFMTAMQKPTDLKIEALVLCRPAETKAEITKIHAAMVKVLSTFSKYVCCHTCVSGIDAAAEDWSTYKTRIKAVIADEVAHRVSVTPLLHGNNLGVVCGRLCNPAVTIADTPMRVATGAVISLGSDPVDKDGVALNMTDLKELSNARFSVPQWYNGYEGTYWADMMMLDAEGGDFTVYENIRVLDYLSRRVYIKAIKKIADRSLNSTPASISFHETYFGKTLRDAALSIKMGTYEVPGLIQKPVDGDISIQWQSRTNVVIVIQAAPVDCPKKITVYIGLDLQRYNTAE